MNRVEREMISAIRRWKKFSKKKTKIEKLYKNKMRILCCGVPIAILRRVKKGAVITDGFSTGGLPNKVIKTRIRAIQQSFPPIEMYELKQNLKKANVPEETVLEWPTYVSDFNRNIFRVEWGTTKPIFPE